MGHKWRGGRGLWIQVTSSTVLRNDARRPPDTSPIYTPNVSAELFSTDTVGYLIMRRVLFDWDTEDDSG